MKLVMTSFEVEVMRLVLCSTKLWLDRCGGGSWGQVRSNPRSDWLLKMTYSGPRKYPALFWGLEHCKMRCKSRRGSGSGPMEAQLVHKWPTLVSFRPSPCHALTFFSNGGTYHP